MSLLSRLRRQTRRTRRTTPPSDGFMSHEEFSALYPGLVGFELALIYDYRGEATWQRAEDGWYRLDG